MSPDLRPLFLSGMGWDYYSGTGCPGNLKNNLFVRVHTQTHVQVWDQLPGVGSFLALWNWGSNSAHGIQGSGLSPQACTKGPIACWAILPDPIKLLKKTFISCPLMISNLGYSGSERAFKAQTVPETMSWVSAGSGSEGGSVWRVWQCNVEVARRASCQTLPPPAPPPIHARGSARYVLYPWASLQPRNILLVMQPALLFMREGSVPLLLFTLA